MRLKVFDYLQSQIILRTSINTDESFPQAFRNSIVVLVGQHLKFFIPSSMKMYSLQFECNIERFQVFGSMFVQVEQESCEDWDGRCELLKISSPFNCSKNKSYKFKIMYLAVYFFNIIIV